MSEATSALNGARFDGAVRVEELGLRGMILLRGDFGDAGFREAAAEAAGVDFPDVRRISQAGERGLAWMSPDELLLLAPYGEAGALRRSVEERLAGVHHLALDVSDARAMFRLTGDGARDVLAKGAPIDLSRQAFGPGDLRRTRLGQVAAAIWRSAAGESEEEVFELICFRSVAEHVFAWLKTASRPDSLPGFL